MYMYTEIILYEYSIYYEKFWNNFTIHLAYFLAGSCDAFEQESIENGLPRLLDTVTVADTIATIKSGYMIRELLVNEDPSLGILLEFRHKGTYSWTSLLLQDVLYRCLYVFVLCTQVLKMDPWNGFYFAFLNLFLK